MSPVIYYSHYLEPFLFRQESPRISSHGEGSHSEGRQASGMCVRLPQRLTQQQTAGLASTTLRTVLKDFILL